MTRSLTNSTKQPSSFDFGVIVGLAAGLGAYALFGTPQGKRFSQKLAANVSTLRDQLDDLEAASHSQTLKDLSSLIDQLKTPASPALATRLKSTLFAPAEPAPKALKAKKTSKRYFKVR